MRAVDTNVIVRLLTRDDERQFAAANRYIANDAWMPTLAIAEAIWVLGRTYGRDRSALATAIEMLLGAEKLVFEDRDVIEEALGIFQARAALGFSDCLILATARQAGHLPLGTFDRRLARVDGAERIA